MALSCVAQADQRSARSTHGSMPGVLPEPDWNWTLCHVSCSALLGSWAGSAPALKDCSVIEEEVRSNSECRDVLGERIEGERHPWTDRSCHRSTSMRAKEQANPMPTVTNSGSVIGPIAKPRTYLPSNRGIVELVKVVQSDWATCRTTPVDAARSARSLSRQYRPFGRRQDFLSRRSRLGTMNT